MQETRVTSFTCPANTPQVRRDPVPSQENVAVRVKKLLQGICPFTAKKNTPRSTIKKYVKRRRCKLLKTPKIPVSDRRLTNGGRRVRPEACDHSESEASLPAGLYLGSGSNRARRRRLVPRARIDRAQLGDRRFSPQSDRSIALVR
jgi:hypothetical protein